MKNKIRVAALVVVSSLPLVTFAATTVENRALSLVGTLGQIVNALIPIAFALGILYFFWGLAKFISSAGADDAREKGKLIMIHSIIAIFVMVSIFGIVRLLGNFIGIDNNNSTAAGTIGLPQVGY